MKKIFVLSILSLSLSGSAFAIWDCAGGTNYGGHCTKCANSNGGSSCKDNLNGGMGICSAKRCGSSNEVIIGGAVRAFDNGTGSNPIQKKAPARVNRGN